MAEAEKIPKIDPAEVEILIERVKQNKLEEREAELVAGLLRTLLYLVAMLQEKKATLLRLREMIFGRKSERRKKADPESAKDEEKKDVAGDTDNGAAKDQAGTEKNEKSDSEAQPKRRGHGRIPAAAYRGAKKVYCRHAELSSGSPCPDQKCGGKVYPVIRPHGFIQFTGSPVIQATHYVQEVVKCASCNREYEAPLPSGVKPQKFDETADATIVMIRFLAATPGFRLAGMQKMCGIPLPISTISERCAVVAEVLLTIYKEMEKDAANAKILYGDDTWLRILELMKENEAKGKGERVGIQTTGIVAEREDGVKIALYLNGRRHTGENVERLLEKREDDLGPVIRMGDAAAANWSGNDKSIECCCLTHARRKFADLEKVYPKPCGYALDQIGKIYGQEAAAKEMSDEERLAYHKKQSLPIMSELKEWMERELREKRVEPNSSLGKAMAYFQNHYEKLTQFCHVAGAPIDNNVAEQALKAPAMIRKNSYFFKTSNGACVGGIILSVLISCRLNGRNIWNYLVWVLRNMAEVERNPRAFLPWIYKGDGEGEEEAEALAA
jgi:transposase